MKLYPSKNECGCDADVTAETAVQPRVVFDDSGKRAGVIRAKQVFHYRERDEARFWHWSDQEVVKI
jgi:hypothetical protein